MTGEPATRTTGSATPIDRRPAIRTTAARRAGPIAGAPALTATRDPIDRGRADIDRRPRPPATAVVRDRRADDRPGWRPADTATGRPRPPGHRGGPDAAAPAATGDRDRARTRGPTGSARRPSAPRAARRPRRSARTRSSSPAAVRSRRPSSPAARRIGCSSCRSDAAALEKLVLHATSLRIPIVEVEGGSLTSLAGFDGHQGIALVVEPRRFAGLADILARAAERGEPPFVLVLDSLEDPHNVGSLLRSAEAAGVHGVIFPTQRQAPLSPSAVKASAGAVEHLLLCPVDDLPGR